MLPPISVPHSILLTESMEISSDALMVNWSRRWNMLHSLHTFCLPLGLASEATICYKHLASILWTKWGITIILLWAGFVVVYPFIAVLGNYLYQRCLVVFWSLRQSSYTPWLVEPGVSFNGLKFDYYLLAVIVLLCQ